MMKRLFVVFPLVVLGLLTFTFFAVPSQAAFKAKLLAYFIDTGQGDAIFLAIPPGDCMLIDAGSENNAGVDKVMAFLDEFFGRSENAGYESTIDVAIASHQHEDHILGMKRVVEAFPVSAYIDNGRGWEKKISDKEKRKFDYGDVSALKTFFEKKKKTSIHHIEDDDVAKSPKGVLDASAMIPFKTVEVSALAGAPAKPMSNENDNSLVLRVKCGKVSFLLTGDAGVSEEKRILKRLEAADNLPALDVDIYKAGHHGSRTSNSEDFLRAASPAISIVSVGDSQNSLTRRHGHPNKDTTARLIQFTTNPLDEPWSVPAFPTPPPKKKGVKVPRPDPVIVSDTKEVYFTSTDGTIVVETDGKSFAARQCDAEE